MYNVIVMVIVALFIVATPVFEIATIGVGYVILGINMALDTICNKIIDNKDES